ncbi:MAG: hypothetical protein Q8S33_33020 [Myxococcales bacterium]|nr:hypothetical protein [Myxococcales bacterium]MDP3505208.1 hypothetical protein [Myxococcales bacterium]
MASADELILQMQHLAAQAKATRAASGQRAGLDRLKSSTQKMAFEKQTEVDALTQAISGAEERVEELRKGGIVGDEAKEYVALRNLIDDSKKQLVKSNAQLQFALDRMELMERREYEAFHAEVRAETHGQLAEDPLFNKT